MKDILSVENMRKSDAHTIECETPSKELMMRAAKGVFDSVNWREPVAIVCGSGNNAGDGYALALLLNDAGIGCTLFCLSDKFSDDGRYYFDMCLSRGIETIDVKSRGIKDFEGFNTIADCILGTGFKGQVRDDIASVIEKINESSAYVVSVDINSGLNGDNGLSSLCVRSDMTVSVGSFKPGHFLNMAKDVMKDKINRDIGIKSVDDPFKLIDEDDIRAVLSPRKNLSNKGTYGYTALIGGCDRYSGAIRLAYMANAAMRSGAGVVKVAIPTSIRTEVSSHVLESTVFALPDMEGNVVFDEKKMSELISNVKTIAFGMGIGVSDETKKMLKYLLVNYGKRLIVDADGLTILSQMDKDVIRNRKCGLILTPHIKEFSRLTKLSMDEINVSPIDTAKAYADEIKAVVLLKGPSTVVTDGSEVYITDKGCAGMATAGSGDVLSGILAATCAYIDDVMMAVTTGAYINGSAGEIAQKKYGSISMIASDTVSCIADVIHLFCEKENE